MTISDPPAGPSPSSSRLSQAVLAARCRMADGREKLKGQHASGSPGIQVCAALTELIDEVVLDLHRAALAEEGFAPERFDALAAMVPYGGYGRRDVAPYSDVDLMLLVEPKAAAELQPVVRRFTNSLYDVFHLGFSQRTPDEACQKSLEDATILTSLAESRFLAGSQPLFERFQAQFRRQTRRRGLSKITAIAEARRDERRKVGDTNYLLEPNINGARQPLQQTHRPPHLVGHSSRHDFDRVTRGGRRGDSAVSFSPHATRAVG
jgi:[protein-PII] uridylyltransferase